MKSDGKKIVMTGGHVTPAIAVIEAIRSAKLPWAIVFVGRSIALEGGGHFDLEKRMVEEKGVRFIPIQTGRIQRAFTHYTFASLCKIPSGILEALSILRREKPDLLLSFGGYIAFPLVVAAAILGIPVVTHEQTRKPGLANSLIGFFAKKICVSFADVVKNFPESKVVYTALPIRKEILEAPRKTSLDADKERYPIIYVTGGTTGSESVNNLMFPLIFDLTKNYTVIHQTGDSSFARANQLKQSLPLALRSRYIVEKYFDAATTAWILHNASLVVGRSGVNTVMELAVLGKRAILIPLPWAGAGEQMENARWLRSLGLGYVVDQKTATSEMIGSLLGRVLQERPSAYIHAASLPRDGAKRVVNELKAILG